MPEYTFTCPRDQHTLTASSESELATKIQEHLRSTHNERVSYEQAMNMAKSGRRVA